MALPTTRAEFKEWCLRDLGKPVIEINVADSQVEDRVDEALQKYWDYHFDGTEKAYVRHPVTEEDATNRYITLPENIMGVTNIFEMGNAMMTNNMFDIRYQIALNDLYTLTNVSMIPYYMTLTHIQFLEQLLVGRQPLRFNRRNHRVYIDMDWERVKDGRFIILECYRIIDPEEYASAWRDPWLLKYATACIKRQWGSNLKKFGNMGMPGGNVFNGQIIFDEAVEELRLLEVDIVNQVGGTLEFMMG